MGTISNPVLPGFHPDPSILRVGEDYYIATSSFEWFPGVPIHHSRDLVNWRLLSHALTRTSQLDLRGIRPSDGVWAPCLSHDGERFYLIYTVVKARHGWLYNADNLLITAEDPAGPWSDPIYLNSTGFDPSLFHDEDGRKYLLSMLSSHVGERFSGIALEEYDPVKEELIGPQEVIFSGSKLGITEGPHLYKRGGYYFLMTAEGGTGCNHAVTIARSSSLRGPYEIDPENPLLTSADAPENPLQKAGHGSLVETPSGQAYLAHLCSRPFLPEKRCPLGRETALQKVRWTEDGWLRLAAGGRHPQVAVEGPTLPEQPFAPEPDRDSFGAEELHPRWACLREAPDSSWLRLNEPQPGLHLRGREGMGALAEVSLVAKRVRAFHGLYETELHFQPEHFKQMAGLIFYYDAAKYYFFNLTHREGIGPVLSVLYSDESVSHGYAGELVPVSAEGGLVLRGSLQGRDLRFAWRPADDSGKGWQLLEPVVDATILSDDYPGENVHGFTGAFAGLCAVDLFRKRTWARFGWFSDRETHLA